MKNRRCFVGFPQTTTSIDRSWLSSLFRAESSRVLLVAVRRLRLGHIAKRLYYYMYGPKNGKKTLVFHDMKASFYASNFDELRALETVFDQEGKSEENILGPIIQAIHPGDVVYDIGASIGVHSIFAALKVGEKGRVISFEPENIAFATLTKNAGLNNLSNIHPIQVALGDRNHWANLFSRRRVGIGAYSILKTDDSQLRQEVEVFPGDYLVKHKDLPLPRAVKIDVEGYEYPVIMGLKKTLSNKTCRLVCCEIHSMLFPDNIEFEAIMDLLGSLGFSDTSKYNRGGEIHVICYKKW